MNVLDWIRERILKFLKIEHLSENPTGDRLNFISDAEAIRMARIKEAKTWYVGDDSELLNLYTNEMASSFNDNPIYNRNKKNYFWAQSVNECNIKRVHDSLAHDMVDTLVNVIGDFRAKSPDERTDAALRKIIEGNSLAVMVNQQEMPLTLAEGYGAFKMTFDASMADYPIIEYYPAECVRFIYKRKKLIGIVYVDYYKDDKGKDYVLLETRRVKDGDSLIEFALFKLSRNEMKPVPLTQLTETANLPEEGYRIQGYNDVLGTPTMFFHDSDNPEYGRSIFDGKIGLLDDLDQIRSQASQTVRVSTPVEYFDAESMRYTKDGVPMPPTAFNRQFIAKEPMRGGDGSMVGKSVETTQPNLNFNAYEVAAEAVRDAILSGVLSPATMGIDVSKKDNAAAQREKEKVTIMTRNNVIARQTEILKDLLGKCLLLQEYMTLGEMSVKESQIDVTYDQFANPVFENEVQILTGALANGVMTPELFIEKLYGDALSEDQKNRELAFIKERMSMESELAEVA